MKKYYAKIMNGVVVDLIELSTSDEIPQSTAVAKYIEYTLNTIGGSRNIPEQGIIHADSGLRKNTPDIGYMYDENRDAFIPSCPYVGWELNEDTCLWYAPIPVPDDENHYNWNEENQSWDLLETG